MQERLQKILSARGIASRRKAEEYITQGLVKVNGTVAKLGQKADPDSDSIEVDGRVIQARQEMLYYLMNKPKGVVTTNIEGKRGKRSKQGSSPSPLSSSSFPSVRDLLPENLRGKIYPIGRLDKDSEGLLLLTNDGVLAYRLTHPKFDHEKEYEVAVEQPIMEGALDKMRRGMIIMGEKTKPAVVRKIGAKIFVIALTEGRNRQIRRMCQKVGDPVVTLKRIRIMTLRDARLKPGAIRPLTTTERAELLASIGLSTQNAERRPQ
ncbi:MAG: pseudouridine synthase [Candidatus Peribacteraceae bacterium]|nr:pseudouridine synthase [Candidatus Peribacteraceae bacterium]MDD5742072.1 pseudouridine synthase [Candidatus Peribacteraceae bacterium]